VQSGRLVPRVVPYRLEQANEALHDLAAGRVVGRAVLIPNEIPNEVR
jgi:D-arabinose 1-dehydrogenase-like Zn-dependent alcohol dehydrogenase